MQDNNLIGLTENEMRKYVLGQYKGTFVAYEGTIVEDGEVGGWLKHKCLGGIYRFEFKGNSTRPNMLRTKNEEGVIVFAKWMVS